MILSQLKQEDDILQQMTMKQVDLNTYELFYFINLFQNLDCINLLKSKNEYLNNFMNKPNLENENQISKYYEEILVTLNLFIQETSQLRTKLLNDKNQKSIAKSQQFHLQQLIDNNLQRSETKTKYSIKKYNIQFTTQLTGPQQEQDDDKFFEYGQCEDEEYSIQIICQISNIKLNSQKKELLFNFIQSFNFNSKFPLNVEIKDQNLIQICYILSIKEDNLLFKIFQSYDVSTNLAFGLLHLAQNNQTQIIFQNYLFQFQTIALKNMKKIYKNWKREIYID